MKKNILNMTKQTPFDPGAPNWDAFSVVSEVELDCLDDKLKLVLPGQIKCVEDSYMGGIIPSVHMVLPKTGDEQRHGVVLSFSEHDSKSTSESFDNVQDAINLKFGDKAPSGFDIIVSSDSMTYEDLLEAMSSKLLTTKSPAWVNMQLRFYFKGVAKPLTSSSIKALMYGGKTTFLSMYDPGHWYPMFDCHSHWYYTSKKKGSKRFTYCFGPCPAPATCTVWGTTSRFGWGWSMCFC